MNWVAAAFAAAGATSYQCRLDSSDDNAWSYCNNTFVTYGLGDGDHALDVRAIDAANNIGPVISTNFIVSTTPPDTSIDSGPPSPVNDESATFTFSSSEPGTFDCRLDNASWSPCTTPYDATNLSDGDHTFEVRAIDADSNADPSPAIWYWTVDTTKPSVAIINRPNDPTSSTNAFFSWDSDDTLSTAECKLDAGAWSSCDSTYSHNYSGLALGSHSFSVRVTNTLSLTSDPDTYTWTIEASVNNPPVASDDFIHVRTNSVNAPFSLSAYDPRRRLLDLCRHQPTRIGSALVHVDWRLYLHPRQRVRR